MDLGIKGRKAIVNGASAGLGKGCALALAREGVDVVLSARGEERLAAAADEIRTETGVRVTAVAVDHTTSEGRRRILEACPEPDILVSTSSPPPWGTDFREVGEEEWAPYLRSGLVGPSEFIRAVVDGMAERGFGRIVNVTTGAAKFPNEMRVLSGPPRAALANYSVAAAKVMAKNNVTINNLLPGFHHTAAAEEQFTKIAEKRGTTYEEEVARWIDKVGIPAERFGDPEDFGAICALLCSRYAGYVVGQSLVVDGGITTAIF